MVPLYLRLPFSVVVSPEVLYKLCLAVPIWRIRASSDVLPALGVFRFHYLRAFPERCPRMTCSTNSSPKRLVNGPELNKKR